jgi:hypothetical protein
VVRRCKRGDRVALIDMVINLLNYPPRVLKVVTSALLRHIDMLAIEGHNIF